MLMDMRGRDGETQRAALESEPAVSDVVTSEVMAAERGVGQASVSETGRKVGQVLALSGDERQNAYQERQAEVASEALVEAAELGVGSVPTNDLEREVEAIYSQERIENRVARETGLEPEENVEQAGAITERLSQEWKTDDNFDIATELGKNGREAQRTLLVTVEDFAKEARDVKNEMTSAPDYFPSMLEKACQQLREKVGERYGRDLGDRN